MKNAIYGLAIGLLVLATNIARAEIPYKSALDASAISESTVSDLQREALPIGNGDLNALLWKDHGVLSLRVAKNDIWDARIDTSQDVPLRKIDVPSGKWSGGSIGNPPSWLKPYPSPRVAALLRIGESGGGAWQCIRSGGKVNEWLRRDHTGIMAIEGKAGASAGYRWHLDSTAAGVLTELKLRLSGTPGARFCVNVFNATGKAMVASSWRNTPDTEQEFAFPIPPGNTVTAVELYVRTKDGARVENRIHHIAFEGGKTPLSIPPGGTERKSCSARLDLRRAVANVGDVRVRVLADRNVFLIETDEDIALAGIKSSVLPEAELGETDGVQWLYQKMPGDQDYAGMEYALAVAGTGKYKAVSLVTSWETKTNVRDAAIHLACETMAANPATLIAQHEAEWTKYWSASGIQLDDPDLQLWWYRMLYMLRCISKPGVMPAGLWAFQPTDQPEWHGDYHHNYNAWQPYWTSFSINHPAQSEPWIDYLNAMLPRFQWLAKTTYDCEGAFVGIVSFAFEPDPAKCTSINRRQIAIPPYGYTLGMIGMSAQICWLHHLYQPDRQYLADKIYPVIRETALFFCSFTEKCPRDRNGKAKFGPSYSPEHGEFGVYNVPFDLAFARYSLKAGIAGAEELGCDWNLVTRFRKALDLLPDYPTAPDADGQPVVVDWAGCKFRQIKVHNIVVPDVPVFPGDQVTWFSPESEKELFRNTLRQTRHNGTNSTIMLAVAKARLGMPEAVDEFKNHYKPVAQANGMFYLQECGCGYYLTESIGIAAGISEFLLQSVDNIIRVFPCWPKDKDASFTNLRAQGGFLVSAELKNGQITKLEITSTVGGRLRLWNPWTGKLAEWYTEPGEIIKATQNETNRRSKT